MTEIKDIGISSARRAIRYSLTLLADSLESDSIKNSRFHLWMQPAMTLEYFALPEIRHHAITHLLLVFFISR